MERTLWEPTAEDVDGSRLAAFVSWLRTDRRLELDVRDYQRVWRWSVDELESFWAAVWDFFDVRATAPYDRVLTDRVMPGARWFGGAELNYAEHVLDGASRQALICLDEAGDVREVSRDELRGQVGALAARLSELGVGRGDRVAAYLPNIPEAVVAMLATTSIGAIWSACAPDFGTQSVVDRFAQIEPKVLFAVEGYTFGGRHVDRSEVLQRIRAALPSVQHTIVARADAEPPDALRFEEVVAEWSEPRFTPVPFDHPLWILFSSGTTGIPKGIVHGHGGILLEHLKSLGLGLDLGPHDRYFFFSSTSWMAWNYLVGGLLHGATAVLLDGSPAHPTTDRLWRAAAEVEATVLGMGAAYVSGCEKAGVTLDRSGLHALRTAIPTGSPLPPSGWEWLSRELPARTRIDAICGGTDVCTVFFGGGPALPVRGGEISARWLGVSAEAWDEGGRPVTGTVGEFVVTKPMPSMPLMLWGDADGDRLREAYFSTFPGVWRQGDWISIGENGSVRVLGRSDATLNKNGVRLGSAEMYAVVERLPAIADSLVVGMERPDGSYYMPLFVVPSESGINDQLRDEVMAAIRQELSPRYLPSEIVEVPALPRTITGKKLEVPVKRILEGRPLEQAVALGSIDRPEALEWFVSFAANRVPGP